MFTVWQLLADFRAGKTISLVKSHATICFASYSAWQTRITRSPNDITLLWCRIQSFSEIENNKFVYGLQNSFVFVVALILDYIPLKAYWNVVSKMLFCMSNVLKCVKKSRSFKINSLIVWMSYLIVRHLSGSGPWDQGSGSGCCNPLKIAVSFSGCRTARLQPPSALPCFRFLPAAAAGLLEWKMDSLNTILA